MPVIVAPRALTFSQTVIGVVSCTRGVQFNDGEKTALPIGFQCGVGRGVSTGGLRRHVHVA